MAETTSTRVKAGGVVCDDRCGCPSPCPGGTRCRCTGMAMTPEDEAFEHKTCGGCDQHCGCNPCDCPKSVTATGKAACKCGSACTCTACAS